MRDKTDLEIIGNPEIWPNIIVLPVKNYKYRKPGGFPECGYLYQPSMDTSTPPPPEPVVYLGNIFGAINPETDEKKVYASLESLIDDGWEVD